MVLAVGRLLSVQTNSWLGSGLDSQFCELAAWNPTSELMMPISFSQGHRELLAQGLVRLKAA
jgi:hypothetical protein